jgi:hypothetical protein
MLTKLFPIISLILAIMHGIALIQLNTAENRAFKYQYAYESSMRYLESMLRTSKGRIDPAYTCKLKGVNTYENK